MSKWRLVRVVFAVALVVGIGWLAMRTAPVAWGPCTWDGNHPRWVLEAQGYDGSDCVHEMPSFLAGPGADWTIYCTMWCEPMWPPSD